MLFTTERQRADSEVNSIKTFIKSKSLNYLISESPFGIMIKVKKSFITDYSKGSVLSSLSSTPIPHQDSHKHSDSGFETSLDLKENDKKDLLKTIVDLEKDVTKKEHMISALENKLRMAEDKKNSIKSGT